MGAICIFSIHKKGHCLVLQINGRIEMDAVVKGGKVQFPLLFFYFLFFHFNSNIHIYPNYDIKLLFSIAKLCHFMGFNDMIWIRTESNTTQLKDSWFFPNISIFTDQDPLEFLGYSTTQSSLNPNISFYNKWFKLCHVIIPLTKSLKYWFLLFIT